MSNAEQELDALLEQIRATSSSTTEQGTAYEKIIRDYLKNDSEFRDFYTEVLSWQEFTLKYGGSQNDTGIDIVAKDKNGIYTAIQCKFRTGDNSLTKRDTDSFFSAVGMKFHGIEFTNKIIATTAPTFAPNLLDRIENDDSVKVINNDKLIYSNIDWGIYLAENVVQLRKKFDPRPHQKDAIAATLEGFKTADRGKLIMACGTGKTLTGLRYIESAIPLGGLVLIAMPSIALISQTIREYCHQSREDDIYAIAVCSQQQRKDDEEGMKLTDLLHPTSTDPAYLADAVANAPKDERCIVFTTYQSMNTIKVAQEQFNLREFDLIIADEAHRTAGADKGTGDESSFILIHNNKNVAGKKRLYMTATPRVFKPTSKKRAEIHNVLLYSMDDESIFGKDFYELSFGRAVDMELLSDYKILVTIVDDDQALRAVAQLEDGKNITNVDAAKMIGIHKAIAKDPLLRVIEQQGADDIDKENWDIKDKTPMKRVINFTPTIKNSRTFTTTMAKVAKVANTGLEVEAKHIDGTMNSPRRADLMQYLREENANQDCRILSNAKCLTEGVDIPALDGICFYSKKSSFVDIIQAIGRVLRKSSGKEYGYIILPICIDSNKIDDIDTEIRNNKDFDIIWQVLAALKSHDEALVDRSDYLKKIKVLRFDGKGGEKTDAGEVTDFSQLSLEFADKVFNAIVDVGGETAYWKHFGERVEKTVTAIEKKLRYIVENDEAQKQRFNDLFKSFKSNIQENITKNMLLSTLAQHITTEPIFDALFADGDFIKNNMMALALNNFISGVKNEESIETELKKLSLVYKHMEKT
ncbi:MAG: DEAD/DEAH box helicase family protein, partial [Endozoicomonadaceae bacterium]|nr:DEAD/DEAH box helicase family protein [Endozoicomonadaceae bacterium]